MSWKEPVQPMYTNLFIEEQVQENIDRGRKPLAFDTPFRFSDAGKCARAMTYAYLGIEGEPFDGPSTFVTGLGTLLHEQVQEAIARKYVDAQFELKSTLITSSGHCDGVIPSDAYGKVLYELKTMGGTAYAKSIGAGAKGMNEPQGPRFSAVLQAALNALANDCDTIVIGHIALEAISRQKAARLGLPEWKRFMAEWVLPKEVWEPMANAELARQLTIIDDLNAGHLPYPVALNDHGSEETLNPESGRSWQCVYCSYADTCLKDGPGQPEYTPVTIGGTA